MKLTNSWNRLVYRLWSPIYDGLFDRLFAAPGRRRALEVLALRRGERVLLVGVGTGADLPPLPAGVLGLGLDLSPHMLAQAHAKLPLAQREILLVQGDAQSLPVASAAFDAAVLNLVLSVVPDGARCWRETLRAVRPGGRLVILDKFAPEGRPLSAARRALNQISTLFGTDITHRLSDITAGTDYRLLHNEPSLARGAYRIILVGRP